MSATSLVVAALLAASSAQTQADGPFELGKLAYERGDWTTLDNGDGTREGLVNAYLEALAWAADVDSTV